MTLPRELTAEELARYRRHIQLEPIGEIGQRRISAARVLLIGLGGLGSPASMYLASAGIGTLALADFDRVELSNLQRQIVHRTADIDRNKVDSARDSLHAINPHVEIETFPWAIDGEDLATQIEQADVVVDASDNFETRFALNRLCHAAKRPLVSGAAVRMEGQINVFDFRQAHSPCYRCIFDEAGEPEEPCALVGVFAPLLGIIGSVQAAEALKLIMHIGEPLVGRMIVLDAMTMTWRTLKVRQDEACPICAST